MLFHYGSHGQFDAGEPACGVFVKHPTLHYIFFYYMLVMTVFALLVNGFVLLILYNGRKTLMGQSQHVYVLGSAITNLCVAAGCNIPSWIISLLIPCVYTGTVPCFMYNIFNFAGGYQLMTNVCLVCYDRWRLVSLGAAYDRSKEVRRAKWMLCITAVANLAMFLVPELVVPTLTGFWYDENKLGRCGAAQNQAIPQWNNLDLGHVLSWFMIVVPWVIIAVFTVLTMWKLCGYNKEKTSQSQVADNSKLLRASFVMFGMITVLMLTFGPLALGFLLLEAPSTVSWYQLQCLLYLQFSSPALEPFVFAITLPKLRKSAREMTVVGRQLAWMVGKLGGLKKTWRTNGKSSTLLMNSAKVMPEESNFQLLELKAAQLAQNHVNATAKPLPLST